MFSVDIFLGLRNCSFCFISILDYLSSFFFVRDDCSGLRSRIGHSMLFYEVSTVFIKCKQHFIVIIFNKSSSLAYYSQISLWAFFFALNVQFDIEKSSTLHFCWSKGKRIFKVCFCKYLYMYLNFLIY